MENKLHNTTIYKAITVISVLIIAGIVAYIPIKRTNEIKNALHKQRYNQVQYINAENHIIPEIINIIKGYIIHNAEALKDIVYINMLTKTKSNNIKEVYNNQLKIFSITKKLINNANKNSVLSHNEKFNEMKNKFDTVYGNIITQHEICQRRTTALQRYISMPVYKDIIDTNNINDIICLDSIK